MDDIIMKRFILEALDEKIKQGERAIGEKHRYMNALNRELKKSKENGKQLPPFLYSDNRAEYFKTKAELERAGERLRNFRRSREEFVELLDIVEEFKNWEGN